MMDEAVAYRYQEIKNLANSIVGLLRDEVVKLGFDPSAVRIMNPKDAEYRLEKDPSSHEYSLVGDWLDSKGQKLGCLLFHADGSFYVEHDVVKPHPTKRRWFVEAVNAWGKDAEIKAEARLLPHPE
jgi:hypothetical protein